MTESVAENKKLKERLMIRDDQVMRLLKGNRICSDKYEKRLAESQRTINAISAERDVALARLSQYEESEFWKASKPFRSLLDIIKTAKNKEVKEKLCSGGGKDTCSSSIICEKKDAQKVMLIAHTENCTEESEALFQLALLLKNAGYFIVLTVLDAVRDSKDSILDKCKKNKILSRTDELYNDTFYEELQQFDVIIVNTMMGAPVICEVADTELPVLWWIHEAESAYRLRKIVKDIPQHIPKNVIVYADGEKARESLMKHRPFYKDVKLLSEEFSEDTFFHNAKAALDSVMHGQDNAEKQRTEFDGCVSIVIPTYNAGDRFKELLKRLTAQRNIRHIEIVIVDSGSRNKTISIAKSYGAKIVEIAHEVFTHSYARNLGVENSTGSVIVMMTQDALPIGDDWLLHMISPIVDGRVAAVTPREQCPDDTELFYKLASKLDAKFRGIAETDQINVLTKSDDEFSVRRKAALSDVACAVDASLIKKMKYRGKYAEDLELGIRLLRNGYQVLISHDLCVEHGHNRSSGYYLKRILTEQVTLAPVVPQCVSEPDEIHPVALKILSVAEAVQDTLEFLRLENDENFSVIDYIEKVTGEFQTYIEYPERYKGKLEIPFPDEILNKCIAVCEPYCMADYEGDYQILEELRWYLLYDVKPYVEKYIGLDCCEQKVLSELEACIMKQMACRIGYFLGKLRYNFILQEKFGEFLKGV